VIGAIVDNKLTIVLSAMLGRNHPAVGIVNKLISPRQFGRFVESCVAPLFDQVSAVSDGLLHQ
jgi:hypothetical protein